MVTASSAGGHQRPGERIPLGRTEHGHHGLFRRRSRPPARLPGQQDPSPDFAAVLPVGSHVSELPAGFLASLAFRHAGVHQIGDFFLQVRCDLSIEFAVHAAVADEIQYSLTKGKTLLDSPRDSGYY